MTIVGGMGLFMATIILTTFVTSPPTRAEFDSLKADTNRHLQNIDSNLSDIKDGQDRIIDHLITKGKK